MAEKTSDFNPRAYQVELYEKAVANNTIIYLPTGAGKTYIAVMLLKKLSAAVQKPFSEGGKRSIFAVNTVPLVTQQTEYIARHTGLSCGGYSGDMHVDYWTKEEWLAQLEDKQVLVMTSQIFLDLLTHGYIQLQNVNLIIFDECHRAVNNHAMRQIMQQFETCPIDKQPRVLALSATLLNANVKAQKIEETISSLEKTFHAKIATVQSAAEVQGYSTNPQESILYYKSFITPPIGEVIERILQDAHNILKIVDMTGLYIQESSAVFQPRSKNAKLEGILEDIKEHLSLTGLYGLSKTLLLHMIQLECLKKYSDDEQTVNIFEYLLTALAKLRKLVDDEMDNCNELERIYKFSSDQILKLFHILKHFNANKLTDQKFCCIIFVKRRFTAKVIYHILKNLHDSDEEYKFLLPDFIVGYSNDPYRNAREVLCISKWNKEVLRRFRNGFSNCIVATDVVDEGVDIPGCTLIIGFDPPMNFRAYIQSKGRARYATSKYIILINENDNNYTTRYNNFKLTESYLQQTLVGKTDFREIPAQKDIMEELYKYEIKPYRVVNAEGIESVITEQSAISLINRYCSTLYNSKFVHLSPIWTLHKMTGEKAELYQVSLKLPTVSAVKGVIFGDVMKSITDAKKSVAMKMCIMLHKAGELTDNLLPRTASDIQYDTLDLFPNWQDETIEGDLKPGTVKKTRLHKIQHPDALFAAYPTSKQTLYLHILHAEPTYSVPLDNRNLVFYSLLSDTACYAILSSKKLPEIPTFPIFMNVGELKVSIKVNYTSLTLSSEQLNDLRLFHSMIFNHVVTVIKYFMVFDNDNQDNCFLVVPLDSKWEINWELIARYPYIDRIQPALPFHFKQSDYDLALVTPNYRASPSVYIVTQICDDITPESSFPTDDFYSYTHYYKEKHQLNIRNTKQPMLEVKPISTKINCIKPRSMKPGLSKRRRADILEDFEEHLVPELCIRIDFQALYWLKATTLPSILHRITQFLIAEDLRHQIVLEARLGTLSLGSNEKWPPLVITEGEQEEATEPMMDIACDESVESSQPKPELHGPEIDILNTEANLYPWTKDQEPTDLDRNIEQIQLIDIEYYEQFMAATSTVDQNAVKRQRKEIIYISRPHVSVPTLQILSKKDIRGPDPVQIMKALTTKKSNDAFDLERLETLGDSFLKFVASLFLYTTYPSYNEGKLTALKGKIVGNRNLYYCGDSKCIPGRMKVDEFIPCTNFIAPAYTTYRPLQECLLSEKVSPNVLYELSIPVEERLTGNISSTTLSEIQEKVLSWDVAEGHTGMEHFLGVQLVADKSVADSVEGLIGVYLTSMGMDGATGILKWFGILPNIVVIEKLLYDVPQNILITPDDPNIHMPWANRMETKLNYKFKNRAYLLQAFTHPSYTANNITECYQRLEFLGDAILDFLITSYIFENCGNLSPGALTDLRSALVNNVTFACLAVRYGLHTALLSYAPKLNDIIDRFVKFQEERNHAIDDELLWVLLEEDECNMAEFVDVPKILGDLFESLIGAIYLDTSKNLAKVWEIIYSLMHKEIDEFSKNVPKHPVRVIWETQGARPNFLKATLIEGTDTVMVSLEVIVAGKLKLFHGFGANKKQAKCAAAKQALKFLRCKY